MKSIFLDEAYVALALIKSKSQFFHKNFITISELNQFVYFLQQEFNKQNLNIVITSNSLNSEDFNIIGETIMKSNACCFNLDLLSIDILKVLYDTNLIANFWVQLEQEKLETLKKVIVDSPKLYRKVIS